MPDVDGAIAKGVAFLESAQQPDGSYLTYLSRAQWPFRIVGELPTTFTPALMLGALGTVDEAAAVKRRLAVWLLKQKSADWSFNYWPIGVPERNSRPFPDDLDDTFCVLIGLYSHDPELIDSTCLAKAVRLLVATERQVGGPYRTWLAAKDAPAWQDVDLAVNCNVAHFLQSVARPLPNLTKMMEQAIISQNFTSPYYPVPHVVVYYLARAYRGELRAALARYLMGKRKYGHWGTPVRTALALSALGRLGNVAETHAAVSYLIGQQQPDGSWPAEVWWLDEVRGRRKHYAGSPALATAFVLEALAGVRRKKTAHHNTRERRANPTKAQRLREQVIRQAENRMEAFSHPLRRQAIAMIRRVERGDRGQNIVLLPHIVARSLSRAPVVSEDLLGRLGLANLYGWTAYTIYDDFLDDEGEPQRLSVANITHRQSLLEFERALPGEVAFQQFVRQTFNRIDAANAWEVTHCRFTVDKNAIVVGRLPQYRHVIGLAERSFGHALTPVGVLAGAGISVDDPRSVLVQRGLRHYLAGRQLQDDLHDWQQDVRKGRVSYVVAYILQELRLKQGRQALEILLPRMERQFWRQSLPVLCTKVTRQAALSRQSYRRSGLFKPDAPLYRMLDALEDSMRRTLQEQEKAKQFLDAYRK